MIVSKEIQEFILKGTINNATLFLQGGIFSVLVFAPTILYNYRSDISAMHLFYP